MQGPRGQPHAAHTARQRHVTARTEHEKAWRTQHKLGPNQARRRALQVCHRIRLLFSLGMEVCRSNKVSNAAEASFVAARVPAGHLRRDSYRHVWVCVHNKRTRATPVCSPRLSSPEGRRPQHAWQWLCCQGRCRLHYCRQAEIHQPSQAPASPVPAEPRLLHRDLHRRHSCRCRRRCCCRRRRRGEWNPGTAPAMHATRQGSQRLPRSAAALRCTRGAEKRGKNASLQGRGTLVPADESAGCWALACAHKLPGYTATPAGALPLCMSICRHSSMHTLPLPQPYSHRTFVCTLAGTSLQPGYARPSPEQLIQQARTPAPSHVPCHRRPLAQPPATQGWVQWERRLPPAGRASKADETWVAAFRLNPHGPSQRSVGMSLCCTALPCLRYVTPPRPRSLTLQHACPWPCAPRAESPTSPAMLRRYRHMHAVSTSPPLQVPSPLADLLHPAQRCIRHSTQLRHRIQDVGGLQQDGQRGSERACWTSLGQRVMKCRW